MIFMLFKRYLKHHKYRYRSFRLGEDIYNADIGQRITIQNI